MKNVNKFWLDLVVSFIAGAALGAVIAAFSAGAFWQGWLAAGVISFLVVFLLLKTWRKMGAGKTLAVLMLVTFFLRLAVGIFIYKALPVIGYDSPVQNAGFFYSDAQARDQAAYQLASSQSSLFTAFTHPDLSDQYGGLLFTSAVLYRFLSPDAARPLLITLLAAFAMTAGLAFLYATIQKRWTQPIALLASWIYALYPDGVLLGSSQMREPFLIALACISLWAVLEWQQKPLRAGIIPAIALAVACLFSVPAGAVVAAIIAAVFILDWATQQTNQTRKLIGLAILAGLSIAGIVVGWMWLKQTLYFDAYTTKIGSGWITDLMEKYGDQWNIPFVTIYGLTQPLLPAAIFEPSLPFWVTIAILRSLAWYASLPILLFGATSVWKAAKKEHKWLLSMFFIVFLIWVIVSSARAGGDQWDNPRYRFILLPFMSLIIAWTIEHYRQNRSPWLWRWAAVIGVFLLFFINFYANRYIVGVDTQLPFLFMLALIAGISVLILAGSLLWDRLHKRRKTG
jgi:hypothetical protein